MGEDLERLVGLERYGAMLEVLTPKQLVVVALRLEGLNGAEMGEELGISRKAVALRLQGARQRLVAEFPDLVGAVEGRRMEVGIRRRNQVRTAGSVSCG